MNSQPVILLGAEWRSRRIHHPIKLSLSWREDRCKRWVRFRHEHHDPPIIHFAGLLLPWEKVFLRLLKSGFCYSGQALHAE
jgi:hypothetical protein